MDPLVQKEILNVLRESLTVIETGELYRLRDISDHIIQTASIYQDQHSIKIAVTIYALSKIYKQGPVGDFVKLHLEKALSYLEHSRLSLYEKEIALVIKEMGAKDQRTKYYVEEVFERAQVKKASKMFEQGISLGQVSTTLGVSYWELMDYLGKTRIVDEQKHITDPVAKLNYTRKLFGVR